MTQSYGTNGKIDFYVTTSVTDNIPQTPSTAAIGSTGDIFTESCPAGKRIVITGLCSEGGVQLGITITLGGRVIYNGQVNDIGGTTGLIVSQSPIDPTTIQNGFSTLSEIKGDVDEDLVVSTVAATTRKMYLKTITKS